MSRLLAAGAVMALGLAACGGSSTSSSPSASSSSPSSSSASSSSASSSSSAGAASGYGAAHTTSSAAPAPAPTAAAGAKLSLAAQPSGQLKFTKQTLTAKAGTVTVDFTNRAPVAHNLTIEKGTNGAVVDATPTFQGGTKTLTVKLAPGTYTFFCSVPGHRTAGMQGTLTVK